MKVASNHLDFGYCLVCRLGSRFSLLIGLEVAVTKEYKNNHSIGFAMDRVIVAGAYGAGAVSVGCFNLAVVIGLEVASIHLGFGFCLVGVFRCRFLLLVGLEVAVPKEDKNNHFRPFAMRHFMFAGTYGADAVSGDCFNPAVVIGLEVASINLGFGYCLFIFAGTHGADAVFGHGVH